jgi:hypothetical protein
VRHPFIHLPSECSGVERLGDVQSELGRVNGRHHLRRFGDRRRARLDPGFGVQEGTKTTDVQPAGIEGAGKKVVLVDIGGETCAEGLGDVFAPEGEEVGLYEDEGARRQHKLRDKIAQAKHELPSRF